jgi:hypothetical protein
MVYRSVKTQFLEFTLALVLPGFSIHIFVNSSFPEQFEACEVAEIGSAVDPKPNVEAT